MHKQGWSEKDLISGSDVSNGCAKAENRPVPVKITS